MFRTEGEKPYNVGLFGTKYPMILVMECWFKFNKRVTVYLKSESGPINFVAYDVRFPKQPEQKKKKKVIFFFFFFLLDLISKYDDKLVYANLENSKRLS